MTRLRIQDMDGRNLAFDLADLLTVVGDKGVASRWRVRAVWCVSADEADGNPLEELGDLESWVGGAELARLAGEVIQVIDGEFTGHLAGESLPWIQILAVDSSYWELEADDPEVLARIRARFREVTVVR